VYHPLDSGQFLTQNAGKQYNWGKGLEGCGQAGAAINMGGRKGGG